MGDLTIRRAGDEDFGAIVELLGTTMVRRPSEPNAALFHWKHMENPFGRSPSWLACDGDRVVGLRTFLQWQFLVDGEVVRAVRAVDTATHPEYQGRGIFTKLTLSALDDLRADGIGFVFNTPNDKSRPGYLKMGWQEVGTLPTSVRLGRPSALPRIIRSRVPADIWSLPATFGVDAPHALADTDAVAALLRSQPAVAGVATNRTVDHLRWRYGFAPLHYRAVVAPGGVQDGVVLLRLRRRGRCTEAAIDEVLVPGGDPGARRRLAAAAARRSGADYGIVIAQSNPGRSWVRVPLGPMLTYRSLHDQPTPLLADWTLTLGDVELF